MLNLLLTSSEETTSSSAGSWWIYVVLLVLVALMLILPTITNKKRMKEYDQMVSSLHVGDTVRTVGGIIGRITKISEKDGMKTFIMETGAKNNKTTMEFDIGSVGVVLKSTAKPVVEEKKDEKVEEPKTEEVKNEEVKAEEMKTEETTENKDEVKVVEEVNEKPKAEPKKKTTAKKKNK